MKIKKLNIKA